MSNVLQYRKVKGLEYTLGKGQIKIMMEGIDNIYYTELDEITVNKEMAPLKQFTFTMNTIKLQFLHPINCNVQSGRYTSTMLCGSPHEGEHETRTVERLKDLKTRFKGRQNSADREEENRTSDNSSPGVS